MDRGELKYKLFYSLQQLKNSESPSPELIGLVSFYARSLNNHPFDKDGKISFFHGSPPFAIDNDDSERLSDDNPLGNDFWSARRNFDGRGGWRNDILDNDDPCKCYTGTRDKGARFFGDADAPDFRDKRHIDDQDKGLGSRHWDKDVDDLKDSHLLRVQNCTDLLYSSRSAY